MKLKFIKLFTLIFICILQIHSMDINPAPYSPYTDIPEAKSVSINLKQEAVANYLSDGIAAFNKLYELEKAEQQETFEKIIHLYIETALTNLDVPEWTGDTHSLIDAWVTETFDDGYGKKIKKTAIPQSTYEKVVNVLRYKPIITQDTESHIPEIKTKLQETARYYLLKHFAKIVLKIPELELQQLETWMVYHTQPFAILKCDFGLILDLINCKMKKDIHQEFEQFETECNDKESRVLSRKILKKLKELNGVRQSLPFIYEPLIRQGIEFFELAMPKDFDIATYVLNRHNNFFEDLIAETSIDRFKSYKKFILCTLVPGFYGQAEKAHHDLKKLSLVEFEGGAIYQNGEQLTANNPIWVLSKDGELCIFPQNKIDILGEHHHSHFFQKDDVGLPIACGGHLNAKQGKITGINCETGHYRALALQLILAIAYFNSKGVVSKDIVLTGGFSTGLKSLAEVLSFANMVEF